MNYTEEEIDRGDFLRDQRRDAQMEKALREMLTNNHPTMTVKFQPSQFVATHGAIEVIEQASPDKGGFIQSLIKRHICGDWGDSCEEDKKSNDEALKNGDRLMSVFESPNHATLWVITEADRSVCTILLPSEY